MAIPRFFTPDIPPSSADVPLPPDEAHHLRHVLRLGTGAGVRIFDGRGHEWRGRVLTVGRDGATVQIDEAVPPVPEPAVSVMLAMALLSGDQMDTVIRDATMIGVARIVPMATEHVTLPKGARGEAATARWRRVAIASAKQCGRAVVPEIAAVTPFGAVLATTNGRLVMCVEPAAQRRGDALLREMASASPRPSALTLLVGPEGGWSSVEIAQAEQAGAGLVQFGPRTLRAESAPIVALSAVWSVWGWD